MNRSASLSWLLAVFAFGWLCLSSCAQDPEEITEDPVESGLRLRQEGWLRGDLHMHTMWSDGDDGAATTIAIAEYLEDPVFLDAHPEYLNNQLDFIAITDHRNADVLQDPEWVSDRLILVPGEELGADGHANLFGISEAVSHDPDNDGTTLDDLLAAEDETHAQGALFSINHPMIDGDPWPWDTRRHDGVEIWNGKWAMGANPFSAEQLAEWAERVITVSPFFLRAVAEQQGGREAQLFRFYEGMLARGLHPALVGGSDRHALFMNGYPTTWVKPEGSGVDGVVGGIRARHTFISRSPVSATIEMTVETDTASAQLGDQVSISAGATVDISLRIGRAQGGMLRLIRGSAVASDEELLTASLGQVLIEADIESDDFIFPTVATDLEPGDWIYPVVFEALRAPGLSPANAAQVEGIAAAALGMSPENYLGIAEFFVDYTDVDLILTPADCDPDDWDEDRLQCLPADTHGLGTFYIPDWIDRALNAVHEEGLSNSWCMGAIGTAVVFIE